MIRLVGHFRTVVEALGRDPRQRVATVPLLTNAERQQVAGRLECDARDLPAYDVYPAVDRDPGAQTPEAVAVVHEDHHITYRELNARPINWRTI